MAEPDNASLPNDPLTAGEDDIERLLGQAETLAIEIATSTGVEPTSAAPAANATAEAGVPEGSAPDPLAATQAVEEQLAELDELVAAEQQTNDTATAAANDSATKAAPAGLPEGAGEAAAGAADEAPPPTNAEQAEVDTERDEIEGDVSAGAPEDHGVESKEGENAVQDAGPAVGGFKANFADASEPVGKCRSWKEWLIVVRESGPRVAKAAALAIPHAFLGILEAIDRPFAGLSPKTKRAIGYVALITVVMGIASLVLPSLLNNNPYANMPP
jgi:hypothetical protein